MIAFDLNASVKALAMALLCLLTFGDPPPALGQTFTVLHTFADGPDGADPDFAGVAIDRAGNLYGTTLYGGYRQGYCAQQDVPGCGVVYRLQHRGSGWTFSQIYAFLPAPDGNYPEGVVVGSNGTVYGATYGGGQGSCEPGANGCGTVFNVRPSPNPCTTPLCPWNETVLYRFSGTNNDGANPFNGNLTFDNSGNIYGTTAGGGADRAGSTYELMPSQGNWTESVIFSFPSGWATPYSGVVFDASGNLYGTVAIVSRIAGGGVYELSPSSSGWTGNLLQSFDSCVNGCGTIGGLILDASGNLYGATGEAGPNNGGTVYELLASQNWNLNLLYAFTGSPQVATGPTCQLAMDAAGNLYGTTQGQGLGYGTVFKLTPSGGDWTLNTLHVFTGGSDGAVPLAGVTLDSAGNLYGTTYAGGDSSKCLGAGVNGCGVVWEITP